MPRLKDPIAAIEEIEPFDIDEVFRRVRRAVKGFPKAAMFELLDLGFGSLFEQLVGSLISARTRDETTLTICHRLFAEARTPDEVLTLSEDRLVSLLRGSAFPEAKARDILEIARRVRDELGGRVPETMEGLMAFRGVGPKIAALTLAVSLGRPVIAVDVHVHRITNRWGYVTTKTPEQTLSALTEELPRRYWIEINERLVPFGKWICTGTAPPKCSTCPVRSMCRRVGVTKSR